MRLCALPPPKQCLAAGVLLNFPKEGDGIFSNVLFFSPLFLLGVRQGAAVRRHSGLLSCSAARSAAWDLARISWPLWPKFARQ